MNVMFLHFFLFTCVTCVTVNDDDDDDDDDVLTCVCLFFSVHLFVNKQENLCLCSATNILKNWKKNPYHKIVYFLL